MPTIHRSISPEKLLRVVPERFRPFLPSNFGEPITAVVFSERVVTGRIARKALEPLSGDAVSLLVCIGRDFTADAAHIVTSSGALLVSELSSNTWTDDSLLTMRTFLATNKRWPDLRLS